MRKLTNLHKLILGQAHHPSGVPSFQLGIDQYGEPIPWSQIRTLVKNGLLKVERKYNSRNFYQTTQKGLNELRSNQELDKDS